MSGETPDPCIGCGGRPGQHKRDCEWLAHLGSVIVARTQAWRGIKCHHEGCVEFDICLVGVM